MGYYQEIVVESYEAEHTSGKHGKVHIRPAEGQPYPPTMDVECSKKMRTNYPVGTKFKILAKIKQKEGGKELLYSSYKWNYEVLE